MTSLDRTLQRLVNLNFNPKNILDLGCYKGEWSINVKKYFNETNFTLIDGIFYNEASIVSKMLNFNYFVEVLNDKSEDVEWFEEKNTGDSMFKERTIHFSNTKPIIKKSNTLDNLFKDEIFDFIKIDCQGAEIPILKGV